MELEIVIDSGEMSESINALQLSDSKPKEIQQKDSSDNRCKELVLYQNISSPTLVPSVPAAKKFELHPQFRNSFEDEPVWMLYYYDETKQQRNMDRMLDTLLVDFKKHVNVSKRKKTNKGTSTLRRILKEKDPNSPIYQQLFSKLSLT
eukprot:TRINITY_DN5587_c0_g1_i2.p1 TRINITY_DN5587_c0_g1~~TRINITY_DN5587_c0_g1_i2.p1  ORF type:complete len:148 (-),score=36.34 TRINITY_DN5587_c0_g1_i2:41-484(-)